MHIEILGAGRTICRKQFGNALEALRESGKAGTVEIIEDIQKIMKYGVMATPALVINGVVMFSGRHGSVEEIFRLLQTSL